MNLKWGFLLITMTFTVIVASGQDPIVGKWKSIDDRTGETKSVVEIYEDGGKIFGRVVKIFPGPYDDQDPVCDKCPKDDIRYNKKIIGMEIIRSMKRSGEEYVGGDILDPEEGKVYRCKLWLEENDLKVRGYWGPFWRTQTWKKVT